MSGCAVLKGLEVGFPTAAKSHRGEVVARKVCAACHALDGAQKSPRADAPTFRAISEKYSSSGLAMEMDAISEVGHYAMPTLVLSQRDRRDLVVYITRLRAAPRR